MIRKVVLVALGIVVLFSVVAAIYSAVEAAMIGDWSVATLMAAKLWFVIVSGWIVAVRVSDARLTGGKPDSTGKE
jgi:hypothetical protein